MEVFHNDMNYYISSDSVRMNRMRYIGISSICSQFTTDFSEFQGFEGFIQTNEINSQCKYHIE